MSSVLTGIVLAGSMSVTSIRCFDASLPSHALLDGVTVDLSPLDPMPPPPPAIIEEEALAMRDMSVEERILYVLGGSIWVNMDIWMADGVNKRCRELLSLLRV